jgi:phosphinothricin acetyltransferase
VPTIRSAVPADADSIASIVNTLLTSTTIEWRSEPYSIDAMLDWMRAHECILVAEEQGEVVGLAAFGPFRDTTKWPGYRFAVENTVHVREDYWRSGVGRALMGSLIETARREGKHSMIAAVDGANESSVRLHEHLGFRQVARLPEVGAKFGRWLDLVLLQLQLDDRHKPEPD